MSGTQDASEQIQVQQASEEPRTAGREGPNSDRAHLPLPPHSQTVSYTDVRCLERAVERGLVDNPFKTWDSKQARAVAMTFGRCYNLVPRKTNEDVFKKAAEILRLGDNWTRLKTKRGPDSKPFLSRVDVASLERERAGLLAQPRAFKTTIFALCVAAIVQGWTQTVGNGANLQWPLEFGLDTLTSCHPSESDIWIFGEVNAVLYLTAGLSGMFLADALSEFLAGRRAPIFASAILIFASAIGSACSHSWRALLINRVVMGIGMGCKATVVPVFAAEIAPAHMRGTLVMNWQLFDALGIFLGFTANLALSGVGDSAWRLQTASLCFPTVVLIFLIYLCPDSPRYQMKCRAQRRRRSLANKWDKICRWANYVGEAWLAAFMSCFRLPDEELDVHEENGLGLEQVPPANAQGVRQDGPPQKAATEHVNQAQAQAPREDEANAGEANAERAPRDGLDYSIAFDTLTELRGSQLLAAKELLYLHVQMLIEQRYVLQDRSPIPEQDPTKTPHDNLKLILETPSTHEVPLLRKFWHLWTIPRIRRATGCSIVCMLCQQLCGVNLLVFYSSTLFSTTLQCGAVVVRRSSDLQPLWLSWAIGITNFVFGLPAYSLIERGGRRWLLLVTTPFMAFCMLIICAGYLPKDDNIPLIVAFVIFFMIFYSPGMGPVPFTISSEVYPLEYRLVGMSVGVFTNLVGAGLLALFVPILGTTSLHNAGLVAIFAGLNVFSFFLIALFVRETAGTGNTSNPTSRKSMSLERLTEVFEKSNKSYLAGRKLGAVWYSLWPFYWLAGKEE